MKTFIFDFDGTLADSKQCSILATQEAFQTLSLNVPSKEQIEHYMGIPIEQSFKEMATTILSNEEFDKLLVLFRAAYKTFENETLMMFEKMDEVLEQLVQQSIQLFVVSSKKTDVLYRNLQALQLDGYFTDWIGSDQVNHYKPHPDGILKLVQQYGLQIEECIMIGDAIFDIQMGQAAGCKTCAVTWGSHTKDNLLQEKPTFCLDEVAELLTISSHC